MLAAGKWSDVGQPANMGYSDFPQTQMVVAPTSVETLLATWDVGFNQTSGDYFNSYKVFQEKESKMK